MGDTCSGTALYSDESINEIKKFLSKRASYVGTDGKFISSVNVDTVQLIVHNLTR